LVSVCALAMQYGVYRLQASKAMLLLLLLLLLGVVEVSYHWSHECSGTVRQKCAHRLLNYMIRRNLNIDKLMTHRTLTVNETVKTAVRCHNLVSLTVEYQRHF